MERTKTQGTVCEDVRPVVFALLVGAAGGAWLSKHWPRSRDAAPAQRTEEPKPAAPSENCTAQERVGSPGSIPPSVLKIAARRAGRAGDHPVWPAEECIQDMRLAGELLGKLKAMPAVRPEKVGKARARAAMGVYESDAVLDVVAERMLRDILGETPGEAERHE